MRDASRFSVVTAAIAAGVTVALLVLIGGSSRATTHASQASIPQDCYVADAWTGIGPAAPGGLTVEWSPAFIGGILVDAFDVVRWTDNSDDETCFVVEMRPAGGSYEVVAVVSANAEIHHLMSGPGVRTYRVYAAHAESRSAYSNEDTVNAVYSPPTPTLTPGPAPAASPSPTLAPPPTPVALPNTGGLPD